jgi:short-subunit dehydrogenase
MERVIILGASRGLGSELAAQIATQHSVWGVGRKAALLAQLQARLPQFTYEVADFSRLVDQERIIEGLRREPFSKLFYVAGGGPFGPFAKQDWHSHEWAWQVSFQFPARLIHSLLGAHAPRQIVVVGSSVAEGLPDPGAASYASAKHALKGLTLTLRKEYPDWDIRLFSPGYMDTEMLPANAAVRKLGVYRPAQIAQELWTWSQSADNGGHRVYPPHPTGTLSEFT